MGSKASRQHSSALHFRLRTMTQSPAGKSSSPCVTVHFYGSGFSHTDPLIIPIPSPTDSRNPLSCEQVCIQSSKYLSKELGQCYQCHPDREIGPAYLPLFGLYAADHSLQQWFSDAHIFTESQDVYFRIKLRLAKGRIPDGIIADYVFLQCADDFQNGRLWTHFDEKNKISDISMLVAYVIWELVSSGQYKTLIADRMKKLTTPLENLTKINHILKRVTILGLNNIIPKKLSETLRKEFNIRDPLMRYLMHRKLQEGTRNFFKEWQSESLEAMRLQFVEEMMFKDVPYYSLEYYPAKRVEMTNDTSTREIDVEVIIRPYQDGCAPGLYFTKQMVCPLDAIVSVKFVEQESMRGMQVARVQLDRRTGAPVVLDFPTREAAESFVTVLAAYYRMQVNLYYNLTEFSFTSPTSRILQALRCFGPLREEAAAEMLRGPETKDRGWGVGNQCELRYLIYQDCCQFDLLHILAAGEGLDGSGVMLDIQLEPNKDQELGVNFCVRSQEGGPVESFTRPEDLRIFFNRKYSRQVIPRDEKCKGMECLEEEEQLIPYYETGTAVGRSTDTTDQLLLFGESEFNISSTNRIGQGLFSDIFRTEQRKYGREVVVKKMTDDRKQVQEAFVKGMAHLHDLHQCSHLFVRFYGQMMLSPLRFVLESVPAGSLFQRLSQPPRLNWLQIGSVLVHLGHCLYDLKAKKMTYGSFCCKKILIHEEQLERLRIKLGDPCETFYLDTLSVDDQQNTSRLPWVAVERFTNLPHHTVESEVYAIGTTIWEMVNGKDPVKEIPFSVKDFFLKGNMLPAPEPCFTQKWVDTQNFESAKPPEDGAGNGCNGANADGQKSTSGTSSQVSCDTVMTSLSETQSAGEAANGAADSSAADSVPTSQKITEVVVKLMRKCWDREPSERPTPNSFIKEAQEVIELAEKIKEEDPEWQVRLCLEALQVTDNITNPVAVQQVQKTLSDRREAMLAGRSEEDASILHQLLNECSDRFIEADLLELPDTASKQDSVLGKGEFGHVLKATLKEAGTTRQQHREQMQSCGTGKQVAVKQMSKPSSKNKQLFLKEALLWSKLTGNETGHINIVALYGIVLPRLSNPASPFWLVMEFADIGSLEHYVRKNKLQLGKLEFKKQLRSMATDIAKGMEYLSNRKLTHGDLAARNILLFSSGGTRRTPVAKISDFGLAHWLKGGARGYYQRDNSLPFPAYWMALEVLEEDRFNSMTDVWSFGTVLWEMFSGDDPAAGIMKSLRLPEEEVIRHLIMTYKRGERLAQPMYCPPKVYEIMSSCWHDRDRRPLFSDLIRDLECLTDTDLNN